MPVSDARGTIRGLFTPREPDHEGNIRSFPPLRWFLPRSSFNAREVQVVWPRVEYGQTRETQPWDMTVRANIVPSLMPRGFTLERSASWNHYIPLHSAHAPRTIPEILDSLHRHEATDEDIAKRKRCGICLEEYSKGNILATGSCDHWFHDICLGKWLAINNTCPICRADWPQESA